MLTRLIPLVEEAGALALRHFRTLAPEDIAEKNTLDLVTVADRAVESFLVDRLRATFPGDGVWGEEGARDMGTTGRVWVIDPIDGTFNFVRGRADWAISVGLYAEGEPQLGAVLQPVRRRLVTGGRDIAPCLDGRPLPPLTAFNPATAAAQVGNGGAAPMVDVPDTIRSLSEEVRAMVRITNASTDAMIDLITGAVDGYVSCGENSWDMMGAWPIAMALGAETTVDWTRMTLSDRARFVIGKPGFVAACARAGLFPA